MAIAFESGSHTPAVYPASKSISAPAGTQAGDVLLLWTMEERETYTTPLFDGFTHIADTGFEWGFEVLYYLVADGSEGATFTHTFEDWEFKAGVITRWSGVDALNPIASGASFDASTWHTTVVPSVTTTTDNATLVLFSTSRNIVTFSTATKRYSELMTGFNAPYGEVWDEQLGAAGATGTRTGTLTNASYRTGMVALNPGSGDPEPAPPARSRRLGLFLPV